MNPNKALWEKGDFTRIAQSMRESGEALVKGLGIAKGLKVLDLGCGDGTTALPAASLGANVLGVDIARNLVEAGNARARSLGIAVPPEGRADAANILEHPVHARCIQGNDLRPTRETCRDLVQRDRAHGAEGLAQDHVRSRFAQRVLVEMERALAARARVAY